MVFGKPFTAPKLTYSESTRRPVSKPEHVTEFPGYTYQKPSKQSATIPQSLSYSTSDQGYSTVRKTLVGSQAITTAFGGSSTGFDGSNQERKQTTENQSTGTAKFISNGNIDNIKTRYLGTSRPVITVDKTRTQTQTESSSGAYGRPYTTAIIPSDTTKNENDREPYYSTAGYELIEDKSSSTAINVSKNRKIIVKLTDLHPILLGKLGAECTCKADPFDIFRGPHRKHIPIASSSGVVDLANYDESDIYVDIEVDKAAERIKAENKRSRIGTDKEINRIKTERIEVSTSIPCATTDIKKSAKYEGPIIAVYDNNKGTIVYNYNL